MLTRMLPPDREPDLPPDPIIERYKQDIDRTLLRERLKRTPAERLADLQAFVKQLAAIRGAATRRP